MLRQKIHFNRLSVTGWVLLFCLTTTFAYAATDKTPPTGTIKINNNATYTTSINVTLTLSATDSGSGMGTGAQMQFSNNNSTWSTAEAYKTTKAWALTSGDGTKTVYVKFKDAAGSWSNSYSDPIILDTSLPSTTISGIDGLWKMASVKVTLTASDSGSGIDKTYYSIDGSTPTTVYTGAFTISKEGLYTPKYYSKDKAGNTESVKTSGNQVKIDLSAPTGSIKINSDAQYTTSTSVTLTLSAQDALSGVAQMQFSNNNSSWSTAEAYAATKTWTLTTGTGTKTVYAKFKDAAGNWSSAVSDSIILSSDTTPPTGTIKVNNNATYTTSIQVTLNLSAQDNTGGTGLASMQFSNDNASWSTPEAYSTTKAWTLSSSDGTKTVYAKFKDAAGNWSTAVSDSIILDTTPPGIIITSPKDGDMEITPTITVSYTVDGMPKTETRNLIEGVNTLTITATDAAGNSGSRTIKVSLYAGTLIYPAVGGEVVSPDGNARLVIPAGETITNGPGNIITQPFSVSIIPLDITKVSCTEPDEYKINIAVKCEPAGIQFSGPAVYLYFKLPQAEVPGTVVNLGYDRNDDGIFEPSRTSAVGIDDYTVRFTLVSFSSYAGLSSMVSQGAPIGSGVQIPLPDMLTGSFGHAIPITVPPGRKGMQPNLALQYRSSSPNSWCGVGWSMNPGYIVRSTKLGPPSYIDTNDTYIFVTDQGSTELTHLTDNLYQAKIESSFAKFYKETDDSWTVIQKDGTTLNFGQDTASKEISAKGTFLWNMTKVTDDNGNYIQLTYAKYDGQEKSYLYHMDYTGNSGVTPANTIEFVPEDRDDKISSYISTSKISTTKRLKEIIVKQNGNPVWTYTLVYEYSPNTNKSLLKSITQSGADGESFPAQTFSYQRADD